MPKKLTQTEKLQLIYAYYILQKEYEEYWVKNVWGFNHLMRDFLLEGHRHHPLGWFG